MLPKASAYVKSYDGQTKWIYFFVEDMTCYLKYAIWDKVGADIKKEFNSKRAYNKIFLKNKIKFYGDKVTDL